MKKTFSLFAVLLASGIVSGAVTINTGAPVRPGGLVVSGQAEAMPHGGFSAISATPEANYKTLKIKVARQADSKRGVFRIEYYPLVWGKTENVIFQSGKVSIGVTEKAVVLHLNGKTYKGAFDFQRRVWYEFELLWEKGRVSLAVDDRKAVELSAPAVEIADTFSLGGMPNGLLRNIILDRPRPLPVQQLQPEKVKITMTANNDRFMGFKYFAHGKALKLRMTPVMKIGKGEKFVLIQSAAPPVILTAQKAGELCVELAPSYSNAVEIRRDPGNLVDASLKKWSWAREGAQKSDRIDTAAKEGVVMERNGSTGMLVMKHKVKLKGGINYLFGVRHKVLKNAGAGRGSFILEARFTENKRPRTYRQYHPYTPLRLTGKWNFAALCFPVGKTAAPVEAEIRIITDAAPCRIALADASLREYAGMVYQPMPRDTDRKRVLTGKALMEHLKKRPLPVFPSLPVSGVAGYDGNIYKMMARSGAELQFVKTNVGHRSRTAVWNSDGTYNFKEIDEAILNALSYAPDAAIGLMLGIDPPLDFGERFPDAAWRDLKGNVVFMNTPDLRYFPERKKKYPYVSYTAPDFRRECGKFLNALGAHLKKQPWGRAVAAIHLWGGGDGQWFYRPVKNDFTSLIDRSPGNLAAMREAIRRYYKNDTAALRKAWGEPGITFDKITFPASSLYTRTNYLLDPAKGQDRKLSDFARIYPELISETMGACALEFQRGLGRKILKSRYYFGTSQQHLLEKTPFDIFVSVPPYGVSRLHGAVGRIHQAAASAALRGKIFLNELDLRTSYSPVPVYHWGPTSSIVNVGIEQGPENFGHLMRKMAAPALTAGQGYWYLMIGGNASLQQEFEPFVKESFDALKAVKKKGITLPQQAAFFWDEHARTLMGDRFGWAVDQHGTHKGQEILFRSGLSAGIWLLRDLTHPRRPKAKINIFALGSTLQEKEIRYIEKNLQKDGNVLVFVFDAGRTAPGGFEKNIRRLTGMTVKQAPRMGRAAFAPVRFPGKLSQHIIDAPPVTGGPFGAPLFYVDDPGAEKLALLYGTKWTGAAVKRHKNWTAVYLSIPMGLAVDHGFLRELALEAGVRPMAPAGDVFYAGNSCIALHACVDGKKEFNWGIPADVLDLTTGTIIARNVTKLSVDMKFGETRWFKLQLPGGKNK